MADWNLAQYLRYGSERLRPALDLMARIQVGTLPKRCTTSAAALGRSQGY